MTRVNDKIVWMAMTLASYCVSRVRDDWSKRVFIGPLHHVTKDPGQGTGVFFLFVMKIQTQAAPG